EWAPAWVYWREGGDYVGWAPCPPAGLAIVPTWFVFVDAHRLHERIRPSTVIVNNSTIIQRTRLITDIRRETRTIAGTPQRVVVNRGPGVDPIQKATGKTFTPVPIHEAVRRTPAPSTLKPSVPTPTGREPAQAQPSPTAPPTQRTPPVTEPPLERVAPAP